MGKLLTPTTHPDHNTIGHDFKSFGKNFYCDSYDPSIGFWMQNIDDTSDRRNVSERAIWRTFHHSRTCRHRNCQAE